MYRSDVDVDLDVVANLVGTGAAAADAAAAVVAANNDDDLRTRFLEFSLNSDGEALLFFSFLSSSSSSSFISLLLSSLLAIVLLDRLRFGDPSLEVSLEVVNVSTLSNISVRIVHASRKNLEDVLLLLLPSLAVAACGGCPAVVAVVAAVV
jgi:hypothetical protein